MTTLNIPPSPEELKGLDQFLYQRIDQSQVKQDSNLGIYNLSQLDGMITAVVSSPIFVPPSKWIAKIWGEFQPVWESKQQSEQTILLMMRLMNSTDVSLSQSPDEFEPIFLQQPGENGQLETIVEQWCQGYAQGMALASHEWHTDDPILDALLTPILASSRLYENQGEPTSVEQLTGYKPNISSNAVKIYDYWAMRRKDYQPTQPARRTSPSAGRNDPCPCGSGKKYKKCCLH